MAGSLNDNLCNIVDHRAIVGVSRAEVCTNTMLLVYVLQQQCAKRKHHGLFAMWLISLIFALTEQNLCTLIVAMKSDVNE